MAQVELSEQVREELMAVTICHDHEARVHSYELLAAEFGLPTDAVEETG